MLQRHHEVAQHSRASSSVLSILRIDLSRDACGIHEAVAQPRQIQTQIHSIHLFVLTRQNLMPSSTHPVPVDYTTTPRSLVTRFQRPHSWTTLRTHNIHCMIRSSCKSKSIPCLQLRERNTQRGEGASERARVLALRCFFAIPSPAHHVVAGRNSLWHDYTVCNRSGRPVRRALALARAVSRPG